jgi:DivIVA domain-containing protein
MDRDEIERTDFPAARKGYEPGAVDAHLRRVADEFDGLGRAAAADRPRATLAEGASEQVRSILEAAEVSAGALREGAAREAGEHVERVGQAAQDMLGKLDRLQAELDRLLAGLRATAESLTGSLDQLAQDVASVGGPLELPSAPPPADGALRSADEPGARLVALNMALEGTPREQTARFLAEHYALGDVDALLDDVYASAGR